MALYLGEDRIDASSPSGIVEYITPISGATYASSTINAWEVTNLSFTVPENHIYIVEVAQTYSSGKPSGIGLHSSASMTQGAPVMSATETTGKYMTRGTFFLRPGTYYICTLRANTGTNTYNVYGLDFTI